MELFHLVSLIFVAQFQLYLERPLLFVHLLKDLLNLDEYPLIWQLIFWIDQPQHFGTIRRLGRTTLLPQLRDIPQ